MIKFINNKQIMLTDLLINQGLSYNKIQALFRKKNIKINGKRVCNNTLVNSNDEVTLYVNANLFNIVTIYEDDNIIIVDKPKKLEVVSETKNISLLNLINENYFAVHRIDFNTEGLVVFAKNEKAKHELDDAFKNSTIEKTYITIVKNKPHKNEKKLVDFLEKFDKKVKIFKTKTKNSKIIETIITLKKFKNGYSLLNVNIPTGRTHQIRAHLAFYNLPIIGDEKYGDFKLNKTLKINSQVLKCYKFKFNFNENSFLNYLNNLSFETEIKKIEEIFENLT